MQGNKLLFLVKRQGCLLEQGQLLGLIRYVLLCKSLSGILDILEQKLSLLSKIN